MSKKVSRRDFLKVSLASAGAIGLTACGAKPTEVPLPVATTAPAVVPTTVASAGGVPNAVKIGVMQPLSGPSTLQGNMMKLAYNYAIDKVNKEGGIKSLGGAPIEIVWSDIQNKQELAVNETERLIQQEKVSVVAGASLSGIVVAATTASERLQVPYVIDVPAATVITQRGLKWLFRTNVIGYQYGDLFADFMKYANDELNAGMQKIALVYPDTEAARSFLGSVNEKSVAMGLDVIFDEAYPADLQDFTTLLTRIKVKEPDVVVTNDASLSTALTFLRQAAAVQLTPKYITHATGAVEFQDWADGAGNLKDGYSYMGQWNPDVPGGKELFDDFLAVTGEKLTGFNCVGIQAAYVIAEALEKAASRDPKDIREALTQLEITKGPRLVMPWEKIKFDETGQNIGAFCIMIQFQGDVKKTVFPTNIASAKPRIPAELWQHK